MIDWMKFGTVPTEENLSTYPTILDILEDVVAMEEAEQLYKMPLDRIARDDYYDWTRVGHYIMTYDNVMNMPTLMPTSRTPYTFYRGQSKYHDPCLPSLFRFKGEQLHKETLRSCLQTAEMIQVMWTHPVIRSLQYEGIIHPLLGFIKLPIMYDGLAQHYGIKTPYIDLTNDIWAGAFFASTTYDGNYHPMVVSDTMDFDERYGVLYRLNYQETDDFRDCSKDLISPIGLQYFNRPGRQCGLVRPMHDVGDFHQLPNLERIFFRHNTEASKFIFTMCQFGKRFIPDDSLANVVQTICKYDRYSKASVELAHNIYYQELSIVEFTDVVLSAGFEITEGLNASFSGEVLEKEDYEWRHGGRERYINDIIIKAVTRISIPKGEVDGHGDRTS